MKAEHWVLAYVKDTWFFWACALVFSPALYLGALQIHSHFWAKLVEHFSVGFFAAGIFGLVIEFPLRKRFAKDVFSAVAGYPLPDAFKEEMLAAIRERVEGAEYRQTVTLEARADGKARVTTQIVKKLKNISAGASRIEIQLGVDDCAGEKSEITHFEFEVSGKRLKRTQTPRANGSEIKPENIDLPYGQEITIWMTFSETKYVNDFQVTHLMHPTNRPVVTVNAPDFKTEVHFGHTARPLVGGNEHQLPALLLPRRTITVKWWKNAEAKAQGA